MKRNETKRNGTTEGKDRKGKGRERDEGRAPGDVHSLVDAERSVLEEAGDVQRKQLE